MPIRRRRILVTTALVLAAVAGGTGCAASSSPRLTVLPTDGGATAPARTPAGSSSPDAADPSGSAVSVPCVDGVAALAGDGGRWTVESDCARVEISGETLSVRLVGSVDSLVLRGERIEVAGGRLGGLIIEGQRNSVSGATIGSATVRGDANTLTTTAEIGALVVTGGDNTIDAERIGSTEISGDGNAVSGG